MKMRICAITVVFGMIGLHEACAQSLEERIAKDISLMRTNLAAKKWAFSFADDEYLPGMKLYFAQAIDETNSVLRENMMGEAIRCIEKLRGREGGRWCTNEEVVTRLIEYYGKYPTEYGALYLTEKVSPARLNQSSNTIVAARPSWIQDPDRLGRLIVHGLMDCVSLADVVEAIDDPRKGTVTISTVVSLAWDAILARHGDTNAEERLIALATGPHVPHYDIRSFGIGKALAYAGTDRILRLAAKELRSEDYIESESHKEGGDTGAQLTARREIWQVAILTAMQNESQTPEIQEGIWFPDRRVIEPRPGQGLGSFIESDRILDVMEAWCTRKFGIKYEGPRKKIPYVDKDKPLKYKHLWAPK